MPSKKSAHLRNALYSPFARAKRRVRNLLNDAKEDKSYSKEFGTPEDAEAHRLVAVEMLAAYRSLQAQEKKAARRA